MFDCLIFSHRSLKSCSFFFLSNSPHYSDWVISIKLYWSFQTFLMPSTTCCQAQKGEIFISDIVIFNSRFPFGYFKKIIFFLFWDFLFLYSSRPYFSLKSLNIFLLVTLNHLLILLFGSFGLFLLTVLFLYDGSYIFCFSTCLLIFVLILELCR